MKIVTLFFACVALLNFPKVDAWGDDAVNDHGRDGTPLHNYHRTASRIWAEHGHTHPTEYEPSNAQNLIFITKVINGLTADWHVLYGVLVPDLRIATCNGPNGYVIVEFSDSVRLYACMKPYALFEDSTTNGQSGNIGDVPVFLAHVYREGTPELAADLAPRDERSRLNSHRLLFHGESEIERLHSQPVGHVRYIKSVRINANHSFDIDGDLYNFAHPNHRF
ncbi:uncharacterized protein LOC117172000 [Belonocnema kinseyi]|uniref:uncharacterized protein LOC117172000 n=1 Tax=Belonocnema kinseyi TaxID=2817044 RepID=UPI00143DA2CD|nr:uncharacterized protein LOC117172000 [Belonocnema kinseyi]